MRFFKELDRRNRQSRYSKYMLRYAVEDGEGGGSGNEGANDEGSRTQPGAKETKKTFDDILSDKEYQSEFDRRVSKAIETAKKTWSGEQETDIDGKIREAVKTEKEKIVNELNEVKFNSAVDTAILKADVVDLDMVKAKLDMKKIKQGDDGSISGLDEQLEELKKQFGFLFTKQKYTPTGGGKPETSVTLKDAISEKYNKK